MKVSYRHHYFVHPHVPEKYWKLLLLLLVLLSLLYGSFVIIKETFQHLLFFILHNQRLLSCIHYYHGLRLIVFLLSELLLSLLECLHRH